MCAPARLESLVVGHVADPLLLDAEAEAVLLVRRCPRPPGPAVTEPLQPAAATRERSEAKPRPEARRPGVMTRGCARREAEATAKRPPSPGGGGARWRRP